MDGDSWERVTSYWSPRIYHHSMMYDPERSIMVASYGLLDYYSTNPSPDVWELRDGEWTRAPTRAEFLPRDNHATVWVDHLGKGMLFGGRESFRRRSDVWFYDAGRWTADEPAPPAYMGSSMVYDPVRRHFLHFGGEITSTIIERTVLQGTTWIYDGKWRRANNAVNPPGRILGQMVFDETRSDVVLFGGKRPEGFWGDVYDTWIWNGSNWRVAGQTRPSPTLAGPIWFDRVHGKVAMVSEKSTNPNVKVLWFWDGTRWHESQFTVPSDVIQAVYADDRRQAILRGYSENRTWIWDGNTFTFVYDDETFIRSYAGFVFDSSARRAFCYGGTEEFYSISTAASWDGISWTGLGAQLPGSRGFQSMAYDKHTRQSIMFGGYSYGYGPDYEYFDDTWSLRWVE
jgi:hypothetical protein